MAIPTPTFAFSFILTLVMLFNLSSCVKRPDGLEVIVQYKPEYCSEQAGMGDKVSVHYTGVLQSTGATFDSSRLAGRDPISFTLGKDMVIQGWERGIVGMCVGEKRKLVIPPDLGYGKDGRPPVIPGDSTLEFDTELLSIEKKPMGDTLFKFAPFVLAPFAVGYVTYHLYKKYTQAPKKKERKEERRKGKKRH